MKDSTKGLPRVLIVDDEEQVTRSLRLVLRKQFDVSTACSAEDALGILAREPEFDVVVSDMRMPGMNGAEFLRRAREETPDSVRILLTGQADAESAMEAVNQGRVFRFMSKPCSPTLLRSALEEAVAQRALVHAERDVLERTLRQLALVLSEIIGTIHPFAAHRSEQLRGIVTHLSRELGIRNGWRVELAAALSHLGCVALPRNVIDAALRGEALSPADQEAWNGHAVCGAELIENVPRLEWVAAMIRGHHAIAPEVSAGVPLDEWSEVERGAELIRTANTYLTERNLAEDRDSTIASLTAAGSFAPEIVAALRTLPDAQSGGREITVRAEGLREGMILLEDLTSRAGVVLSCTGSLVTATLRKLAVNFSMRGELREPLRVRRAPGASNELDSAA